MYQRIFFRGGGCEPDRFGFEVSTIMRLYSFLVGSLLAAFLAACSSSSDNPTVRKEADPLRGSNAARTSTGIRGDYAGYSATASLVDRLVKEEDFDRAYLERLFSRVERQQWILDFLNKPKSKKSTGPTGAWTRYRAKFLTEANISKGASFWRRYDTTLRRAEAKYGVPPEYVVAIVGVETRYGGYTGKHRVIDALATLAFDFPRRSEFFTGELEAFLIMSRDEGFDPFQPRGSYAGAMGLGQFMPSSFHKWAVDFDGNGKRDLWNPVDAIGSVANYFADHGWREGEPVIVRARASGAGARAMRAGYNTSYSVDSLGRNGIVATAALDSGDRVSLIKLDSRGGYEYWLGLKNFYVITRYNHSSYYAMAVHQLAQAVRGRHGPAGPAVSQSREANTSPVL
jgi:membrane-bound lytic murein transglycosylase B